MLRKKLIRMAHTNPELRPHILPLLKDAGVEKEATTTTVQMETLWDGVYEFLTKTLQPQDFDFQRHTIILSFDDDDGDAYRDYTLELNLMRGTMVVKAWKKTYGKLSIDLWNATSRQLIRAHEKLAAKVPWGGDTSQPDSPSLQDRAPMEYFTERMAFGDQSWDDYDSSAPETIWGPAQQVYKIVPGVAWYSTAGHGGIGVDPSAARKYLSDAARKQGDYDMGKYWYEEDEMCLIPLYEMPEWAAILKRKMGGGDISKYTTPERMKRTFPRYWRAVESSR